MKIVHFCLSCFFIDGQLYQENELVREHVRSGHDVLVVASTHVFDDLGHFAYCEPKRYIGVEGARVVRLPYRRWLPHFLAKRLRAYPDVRRILNKFHPDVIMFHGASAWDLGTVASYVRDNPGTVFHIDSHADGQNSGKGWLSYTLHRCFFGPILRRALRYSGPLLCVGLSVMEFAQRVYRIPPQELEFYPLGGQILAAERRVALGRATRERLGIPHDAILMVQSGKQNQLKKLPQSLRAFAAVPNPQLRLVVAGVLQADVRDECERLITFDSRVAFIGWQDAEELTAILSAADVYLQPGSQSATMQHALCCGCAVILDRVPAHEPYIVGNGWLVSTEDELQDCIAALPTHDISLMGNRSLALAEKILDYAKLSSRILR